jgi:hypothetical protein
MTTRPRPRPRQILFAGSLAAALALGCSDNRIAILDGTTYAPDGHLVVFGWPIRVYDSTLRATSPAIPSPADRSEIAAAALSSDGMLGLVAHGQSEPSSTPPTATLFRVPSGEVVSRFSFAGFPPAGGPDIEGFALSPTGDRAFLASEVRRTADGALLWTASTSLSSPVFSADGSVLVAIGSGSTAANSAYETTLMAFDATTGAPLYANALGGGSELTGISLVGDGGRLAGVLTICQSRGCWQYLATFSTADGRLLSQVPVPAGVDLEAPQRFAGYISCARTQDLCVSSYVDAANEGTALWRADGTFLGTLAVTSFNSYGTLPPKPRLAPDGSALALVGQTAVAVYDVNDGRLVGAIGTGARP